MKTYYLCGTKAVQDEQLKEELEKLICDVEPFYVIPYEDCSTSELEFCYAFLYYKVKYKGKSVVVVTYDLYEESGPVNGVDLLTGVEIILPPHLKR